MSSDPIGALDRWGLDRTRELLVPSSPRPHPLKDPDA
jgi:alpha-galactosidase